MGGFGGELLTGANFVSGIERNNPPSVGFCFESEAVAWRDGRLISFIVISVDPNIGDVVQKQGFALVFHFVENACR